MIVDASVAIKWLAPEAESDLADRLLIDGDLAAPDLIFAELANAIWKKQRRGEIVAAPPSLDRFSEYFDVIEPCQNLAVRATEIAVALDHPAYDCFYLALAESLGEQLVTADLRLLGKVRTTPYSGLVIPLNETGK
jgi:predicted nucleic acid-binding protein